MRKGAAANFYWVIEGFDGAKRIYSEKVRSTLISIPKMKELLACLAARAGLDYGEIVDCHTIRNARRHRSHLECMMMQFITHYVAGLTRTSQRAL
jgi:hypothetical protein